MKSLFSGILSLSWQLFSVDLDVKGDKGLQNQTCETCDVAQWRLMKRRLNSFLYLGVMIESLKFADFHNHRASDDSKEQRSAESIRTPKPWFASPGFGCIWDGICDTQPVDIHNHIWHLFTDNMTASSWLAWRLHNVLHTHGRQSIHQNKNIV